MIEIKKQVEGPPFLQTKQEGMQQATKGSVERGNDWKSLGKRKKEM